MNNQPESIEALRTKCILLEDKIQLLEHQLRVEKNKNRNRKRYQETFWEWIREPKNYIFWKIQTGTNKAAA